MPNLKATIVWYCNTPIGPRRYRSAMDEDESPKTAVGIVNGKECALSPGRFQIRYFVGRRMKYDDAGTTPDEAIAARDKMQRTLAERAVAIDAGLKLDELTDARTLRNEAIRFVRAAVDRGSVEAAQIYGNVVNEFLDFCMREYAKGITREDLLRYQRWLKENHKGDRTIFNRWRNIRAFLIYIGLPVKEIARDRPYYEQSPRDVYTTEEMKAFFGSLRDQRLSLTFELLLKTGLLEHEAVFLEWSDINLERGFLKVRSKPKHHFKVKQSEQREIPIEAVLLSRLREHRKWFPHRRLVTGTDDGPDTHLLRKLKGVVHAAGLNCGTCDGCRHSGCERWYLQKFRNTFVKNLLNAGMDIGTVMRLTGHSHPDSLKPFLDPADPELGRPYLNAIKWGG